MRSKAFRGLRDLGLAKLQLKVAQLELEVVQKRKQQFELRLDQEGGHRDQGATRMLPPSFASRARPGADGCAPGPGIDHAALTAAGMLGQGLCRPQWRADAEESMGSLIVEIRAAEGGEDAKLLVMEQLEVDRKAEARGRL